MKTLPPLLRCHFGRSLMKTMIAATVIATAITALFSSLAASVPDLDISIQQTQTPTPTPGCTDDTWTATSTNAPTARYGHTAVWTGSEMIVWGGYNNSIRFNTGGRYNPVTDSWTATSTTNAPTGRLYHTAVWTGSEMIVWGGFDNSGVVNTGGRYNPVTDTWTATSTTNAPTGRGYHTAVWTGSEMIGWGGYNGGYLNTGGRYNPVTDSWTATSTTNAPTGREYHTAVWTGSEMIGWGGLDSISSYFNTGGKYNPGTDSWTATSTTNAPTGRAYHTAVWTGSEMIVWGGYDGSSLNTAGRYNPVTDSWTATSTTNAPTGRQYHTTVWTGSEMIVWGGFGGSIGFNTGGRYNPGTDSWTATSTTNAPTRRYVHTAVWTGSEMIVWGGYVSGIGYVNTGGRYCAQPPTTPTPTPTPTPIDISGNVAYCPGSPRPVQNVTLNLTGDTTTSTMTNGSGNYTFSSLASGGTYTVTPTKGNLPPGLGTSGIDTGDALAVQKHLACNPCLTGCALAAAHTNVNNPTGTITIGEALFIQAFFLNGSPYSVNNVSGQWRFSPANRTYTNVTTSQTGQNYAAYALGDVNGDLTIPVGPLELPTTPMSVSVPVAVAQVALPNVDPSLSDFVAAVTTSNIAAGDKLQGFQGDFTFDSSVVTFQSTPVVRAGLTANGNWALAANVLGTGTIKTLRVSCFALDANSVFSGEGPLFELRMTRVSSKPGANTPLIWAAAPNNFMFLDDNVQWRAPASTPSGSVTARAATGRR